MYLPDGSDCFPDGSSTQVKPKVSILLSQRGIFLN